MKQQNFSTKQAVKQGERMILVLKKIIQKSGRTSLKEVTEWMEISPRNANVFVNQLLAEGYLETNSKSLMSLKATEKAKQLFEVQP